MSRQANNFSRREMLRRRILAGFAAILMGASLVFSGSASAHNIDLAKAREVARDFAMAIRASSDGGYYGKYLHYSTNCWRAFPGHNHIVKCTLEYQNAKDTEKGVYTCKESIEVFLQSHKYGESYVMQIRHTSMNKCGAVQPDVHYVHP